MGPQPSKTSLLLLFSLTLSLISVSSHLTTPSLPHNYHQNPSKHLVTWKPPQDNHQSLLGTDISLLAPKTQQISSHNAIQEDLSPQLNISESKISEDLAPTLNSKVHGNFRAIRALQQVDTSKTTPNNTYGNSTMTPDQIQSYANFDNVAGSVVTAGVVLEQFAAAGASSAISTVISVNMIQYVRFINIDYPKDLQGLYKGQPLKVVHFNFGPLVPASLKPEAAKYPATGKYALYQVTALFLVNYWKTIITIPIILFGAVIVILIGKIPFKHPLLIKAYKALNDFLVWNFLISFVLSNIDSLTLWSIVGFQDLRLDSDLARGSCALSIILIVIATALMGFFVRKVWTLRYKEKITTIEEKAKKHPYFVVLFKEFKTQHFHQELYFLFIVMRIVLNNIIIGVIDSAPLVQCCLLLSINVIMLIYIVLYRPYASALKNAELISYEIVTVVVNVSCIRIAMLDSHEQGIAYDEANAIIHSNITMSISSLAFTVIRSALTAHNTIKKKLKERKEKDQAKNDQATQQPVSDKAESSPLRGLKVKNLGRSTSLVVPNDFHEDPELRRSPSSSTRLKSSKSVHSYNDNSATRLNPFDMSVPTERKEGEKAVVNDVLVNNPFNSMLSIKEDKSKAGNL